MYCRLNIWQSETKTYRNVAAKIFFFTIHFSYVIAVFIGLFLCDDDEFIFQIAAFMAYAVVNVKFYYIMQQQNDICLLLDNVCNHSTPEHTECVRINDKINSFVKLVTYFIVSVASGTIPFFCLSLPMFTDRKKMLPLTIGFPLNWRNDEFSFWTAYFFIIFNHALTIVFLSSTVIVWYIMINCSIQCESLGNRLKLIGTTNCLEAEENDNTLELIDLIKKHQELRKYNCCWKIDF